MTATAQPIRLVYLHPGDRLAWTATDGAVIYVVVRRVSQDRGIAWLRCHHGDRTWTRRHEGDLFPSMVRREWTTADLLDTL